MKLRKQSFMNVNNKDILSRNEMRMVMAGRSTNCQICEGKIYCKPFDHSIPPANCGWGNCGDECEDDEN